MIFLDPTSSKGPLIGGQDPELMQNITYHSRLKSHMFTFFFQKLHF